MIVFRVANVKESAAHFLAKGLIVASPYVDQEWGEEADFFDIDGNPLRIARFKA
ncbi:hypothetical protein [Chitinimonas sp. BJB300]|uniref:hypothetical protein n=1 Tax=Chitinimonas sp. BJB300 TaxID=1559339 RepID=UPI0013046562|nr:hypothetical protein [Chitinimonas sp. BJB300]